MRPHSTYRLQITQNWDLQDAAALVPYLRRLGVDWVYLSPVLAPSRDRRTATTWSTMPRWTTAAAATARLRAVAERRTRAGLGVLVDIVPNHVGVATPPLSVWWWDVLRAGPGSAHAVAFDIDWAIRRREDPAAGPR